MNRNPVKPLPPDEGAFDTYKKYGVMMFPQQRAIYEHLARELKSCQVLEVGCGIGLGAAILERSVRQLIATDSLEENIKVADALYPWVNFGIWDVEKPAPWDAKAEVIVAVEVLEHLSDPVAALKNMCAAASHEVWISTPNGVDKPRPPDNPYHVCEYTPSEVLAMFPHGIRVTTFMDLFCDPVLYRAQL